MKENQCDFCKCKTSDYVTFNNAIICNECILKLLGNLKEFFDKVGNNINYLLY